MFLFNQLKPLEIFIFNLDNQLQGVILSAAVVQWPECRNIIIGAISLISILLLPLLLGETYSSKMVSTSGAAQFSLTDASSILSNAIWLSLI